MPILAHADGTGSGTTDVTVQVADGDENITWSAPTQVPFKATAAGTLIGPAPDSIAIKNLSAFSIRVKTMDTTAIEPFHLVDDVDKSTNNNDMMMTWNGIQAENHVELPDDGTWAMGYVDNSDSTDTLPLTYSNAKIARVTSNLVSAQRAATISWTVTPTNYVKPEPKPDINGVIFAVYSDDDKSLILYKRNREPEIGDMFNGRRVTDVWKNGQRLNLNQMAVCQSAQSKTVIVADYGIKPINMEGFLAGSSTVEKVDLLKFDFSECTSFAGAFTGTQKLQSVDLTGTNLSKVSNFNSMFNGSSIQTVNFSGCLSSTYADMTCLLNGCSNITNIDFEGWKAKPTSLYLTFANCPKLEAINGISNFDTSRVTTMRDMFTSNESLITVSGMDNWDVSNVTNMYGMFWGCISLTSVGDLSGWRTSSVTNMYAMFDRCTALQSVGNLSNWNVSNVTNMSLMFVDCCSLTTVGDLSNWDILRVTDMENMFTNSNIIPPSWYKGSYKKAD